MKQKQNIAVHPSIMAGDWGKMADEAKRIEDAGADAIHLDVMDGHFVKNLTMGPSLVAAINKAVSLPLDVHLMVYEPFEYIERFIEAGADSLSFHFEATENIADTLTYIKKAGKKAFLAFNPDTSESFMVKYLDDCDGMLLMTVHPGFGGQSFIEPVLEKVSFLKRMVEELEVNQKRSDSFVIQVDGGIDESTAKACIEAGANTLVSGTYLMRHDHLSEAINSLRKA